MNLKNKSLVGLNSRKELSTNMAISLFCKPVSMLVGYLYVPVVLNYLGIEKYGIWSTILTILSWISYFDIGIGNGLRNKLTESISKRNGFEKKLISSAYAVISVIMSVVALLFSIVAFFTNWNKVFGVEKINEDLKSIIIVSIIFVSINFILSICKNVLYALQKAAYVSVMELLVQLINLFTVLIVKNYAESNLFLMAIIYGSSMLFVNLLANIILYTKDKFLCPNIKEIDLKTGGDLTNIGLQFFVIQICALVLFTTDSLLISYLYGATNVTPYSTVNKLFNVIIGIFSALLVPVWSAITKAKVEKNYKDLKGIIKKMYIIIIPFIAMTVILMILFRRISDLWLGQNLDYTSSLIFFGGIYCILSLWTNMHGNIANGFGILKKQMLVAVVQATINIPISLLAAKVLELKSAGILLGTDISLVISAVFLPIFINEELRRGIKK